MFKRLLIHKGILGHKIQNDNPLGLHRPPPCSSNTASMLLPQAFTLPLPAVCIALTPDSHMPHSLLAGSLLKCHLYQGQPAWTIPSDTASLCLSAATSTPLHLGGCCSLLAGSPITMQTPRELGLYLFCSLGCILHHAAAGALA